MSPAPYQLTCAAGAAPSPPHLGRRGRWLLAALQLHHLFDEFDPGSGSTLAACLTHVSRTHGPLDREWRTAEEHVRTYPLVGNNAPKGVLIPRTLIRKDEESLRAQTAGRAAHQVVGGVMAYQARDG